MHNTKTAMMRISELLRTFDDAESLGGKDWMVGSEEGFTLVFALVDVIDKFLVGGDVGLLLLVIVGSKVDTGATDGT